MPRRNSFRPEIAWWGARPNQEQQACAWGHFRGPKPSSAGIVRTVLASRPGIPPLRAIGVDNWAHRKRQRYGTIVVDLERRRPVALLPNREADTLAGWLRRHAGIAIIARDRMKAYNDGARAGAPQAIQVADRLHLLQNLAEALDQVFSAHGSALRAAGEALSGRPVVQPESWHRRPGAAPHADTPGPDASRAAPGEAARRL